MLAAIRRTWGSEDAFDLFVQTELVQALAQPGRAHAATLAIVRLTTHDSRRLVAHSDPFITQVLAECKRVHRAWVVGKLAEVFEYVFDA